MRFVSPDLHQDCSELWSLHVSYERNALCAELQKECGQTLGPEQLGPLLREYRSHLCSLCQKLINPSRGERITALHDGMGMVASQDHCEGAAAFCKAACGDSVTTTVTKRLPFAQSSEPSHLPKAETKTAIPTAAPSSSRFSLSQLLPRGIMAFMTGNR